MTILHTNKRFKQLGQIININVLSFNVRIKKTILNTNIRFKQLDKNMDN